MTTSNGDGKRAAFLPGYPAFVNELAGTLAVHSQYVLHSNIRDRYLVTLEGEPPPPPRMPQMLPLLWKALRPSGYECFLCYDPVDGITVYPDEPGARKAAESLLGARAIGRRPTLEKLRAHLAKVVGVAEQPPFETDSGATQSGGQGGSTATAAPVQEAVTPKARAAFVIDYAARITRVPGQLDPVERDFFLYCQKLALTAKPVSRSGARPGPLYNPIIWLVEGERDLPAWLTAGVEPIRTIAVGMPTLDTRENAARVLALRLTAGRPQIPEDAERQTKEFARRTDGMTIQAMRDIVDLARDRGIEMSGITDATRIYKLGVDDDLWRRDSVRVQIKRGEVEIAGKVKGQELAIKKTIDILKRSALGLSGAQATSTASRPRGVLFFAGPTGVGKTELAKQVADILFGDVNAFLRFDMSEFAQDHAADRLTGSPPGYVGFEAGGELTGAVRRKPFQVILFDEIEKAHPLVLDKFLQILEDGRLTDGQGITTHFSECVLIFTSNLGIIETDPKTGVRTQTVHPGMDYPDLEATVKAAIREHFTNGIGRPELLNRLGDNIVIFDFISEEIAREILDLQLNNVIDKVSKELEITLRVEEKVHTFLRAECTKDLGNGGRGIGSLLESNLINPLARFLFDNDCSPRTTVVVRSVERDESGAQTVDAYVESP